MKEIFAIFVLLSLVYSCKNAPASDESIKLEAPLFDGLGDLHYPVTTKNELAQKFFNQGLTLSYAFNHAEAKRSFTEAARLDSACAMAYWGLALVLGTNINAAMDPADLAEANAAVSNAVKYSAGTTEKERDMIMAISKRYPPQAVDDLSAFHAAYADAMRAVHLKYPDDIDIATLYAEALMDQYPWNYWLKDGTPQPWTMEIVKVIEQTIGKAPKHVGANHLYIHITEASKDPGKAIASADLLRDLLPAAGHLVHMPSHTYIRTGRYHEGVIANEKAGMADSSYITQCNAQGIYPLAYHPHNDHFLSACAFFSGESKKSISAAYATARHTQHDMIGMPGYGTLEHYAVIPLYVLVRFAKWDEILNYQEPSDSLLYAHAVYHYARGMAHIGKKNTGEAKNEFAALQVYANDTTLKQITIWDINNCYELAQIALHLLDGEIHASLKNYPQAISSLTKALTIEDGLAYNEPPDWFFSVRHHLGAVMLDAGKYANAERIYIQDMETFPENGWALIGLYTAYQKQNKNADAESVKKKFDQAWKYADIQITGSRIL